MTSSRSPSVFGRAAEMELLRGALVNAAGGRGGLVLLTGAAGLGKSRLLTETAASARARGMTAVVGRASEHAAAPFAVVSEALRQAVRSREGTDLGRLGGWAVPLAELLPEAVDAPVPAAEAVSPLVRGEAVLRLLGLLSTDVPLLMGLEDLQWADPDTMSLLEYVADGLAQYPVLLVATVRSDPSTPALARARALAAGDRAQLVELEPLSRADAAAMARACNTDRDVAALDEVVDRAEGVPLLVEELLASRGVPRSFADSVRGRLSALDDVGRRVLCCAAVLGRRFDYRLLAQATGADDSQVGAALERGVEEQLLDYAGDEYLFRHGLTCEAVLETVLPHARAELARAVLHAMQARSGAFGEAHRERAADLARQAGLTGMAAELLRDAGTEALRRGALATAVDLLREAAGLARDAPLRRGIHAALVEALAQAGRLDECWAAGSELLAMQTAEAPADRVRTHLSIARAAVEATAWLLADTHLAAAESLLPAAARGVADQWRVLRAELVLTQGNLPAAEALATEVLTSQTAGGDVRCHAYTLLGRSSRVRDLVTARSAFNEAWACAELHGLPVWRLRATHELGTIDLFDHAGVASLQAARVTAEELGALSTRAVLDIQLAAAYLFRFDADLATAHARAALAMAEAIRADQLRATALVFVAEAASLRQEDLVMETHCRLALEAAPRDAEIEGSVWGARGVAALLGGLDEDALRAFLRAEALLAPLPQAGPGIYRGLLPLLLATRGDHGAREAIAAARHSGIEVNRANRGLLLLAEAALTNDQHSQAALDAAADHLAPFPVWSDIGWMLLAEAGFTGVRTRLSDSVLVFERYHVDALARRCRNLLSPGPARALTKLGVTPRESEILALVARGLTNREIAAQFTLSPRTVEKHVESLLRKTGAATRTQLAALSHDEQHLRVPPT